MLKVNVRAVVLCFGLVAGAPCLIGQGPQANMYFALGTATDSSNGQTLAPLGIPYKTPEITGLFPTVGGSVMFNSHIGAGAELSWRASTGDYAGLNYRPFFYDFNAIWQPVKTQHFVPEIQGGIGGVRITFSANQQSCSPLVGCSSISLGSESSDHFQGHFAAAARLYVTPHIFFRPAVDVHLVNNFFQFGRDWVPEYSLGFGLSFGRD